MIRRRTPTHNTKTGHERWLVSYADFITLLFAFFVVMYAVSQVSEQKYRALSDTLAVIFDGKVPVDREVAEWAQRYPSEQYGRISGLSPVMNLADTRILATDVMESLVHLVDAGQVKVAATEDWVQIDVNANLLFASASAEPSEQAREVFQQIATLLAPYENAIEVSGHTDNVPIHTLQYASNWELSAARAASVVRLLSNDGVSPARLAAVGYGEYRPRADNASEAGRRENRRVSLFVANTPVLRPELPLEQLQEQSSTTEPGLSTDPDTVVAAPDGERMADSRSATDDVRVTDSDRVVDGDRMTDAEASDTTQNNGLNPVRLQSGGLLFSSDPDRLRNDQ